VTFTGVFSHRFRCGLGTVVYTLICTFWFLDYVWYLHWRVQPQVQVRSRLEILNCSTLDGLATAPGGKQFRRSAVWFVPDCVLYGWSAT
jgi:hypothetical protein